MINTVFIAMTLLCSLFINTNLLARVNVDIKNIPPAQLTTNRQGGVIAEINNTSTEINNVTYTLHQKVKVYDIYGKIKDITLIEAGMFVNFTVISENGNITISEIWVVKK